jgi:hypothetical protein
MEFPLNFEKLFREENCLLSQADPISREDALSDLDVEAPGSAGEPWVRQTPIDRVGLAFSGGGIRSATFNLGILKGLHELGLLKHVDYLSTVSGGGYVGAWWSAWRARWGMEFPETGTGLVNTDATPGKMNREPEEVRHLREFSNFLSPRIGFFQSEMWNAIMAVLSAVLPAVLVATSVIALALLAWLGLSSLIVADALGNPVRGLGLLKAPLVLSAIALATYIVLERKWFRDDKAEKRSSTKWWARFAVFHLLLGLLILLGICFGWCWLRHAGWMNPDQPSGVSAWEWSTGISPDGWGFSFSPYVFAGPILWAGLALCLLVPRLLLLRIFPVNISSRLVSAMDRALARLLGSALVIGALGALWLAGCWLNYTHWGTRLPAGGALLSGGVFALLRNWMGGLGPGKKGGVMDVVKPLIPQVLAYVAIALWAICIAALLAGWLKDDVSLWWPLGSAAGIVVFALLCFDAAQVSMHSFYRNRLSRAYLGASNLDARTEDPNDLNRKRSAEKNRQTDVRKRDDIELRALSPTVADLAADKKRLADDQVYITSGSSETSRIRPLHLVCCAANDLGGDHLENLARGSRSAVLSKFGFAIGNYWKTWEKEPEQETLGLGSAITASAAAFNSNMGSLSMTLGAGVTFLCTALNLRLGLWLPHPLSAKQGAPKVVPGWLFLKEMFGLTNSGLRSAPPDEPTPMAEYVHLSDGAHFENLALYELVRRHCRYIIVSDCGADAEVTFDDFGNAVRRIREDFGVEIDIDLSPLKPDAARLSKQHVAVGTISYDPKGDRKDTAILLYFKPTLTGDEPCDIAQYRTRNEAFPHESTGDQFYDEAQWESYRRLGEHAARSALRFVERHRKSTTLSADVVFNLARWEWYQSPERLNENIVELTGRLSALETELREQAPAKFVREMFPELRTFNTEPEADAPMNSKEMGSVLHFLVQIIQLMEDVWLICSLDTHFNDPNNLGWMNMFQRWAYTPTFRLWWPLLKSMYGSKFRRFMEERLDLADEDYPETLGEVDPDQIDLDGLAMTYWTRMFGPTPAGKSTYAYKLHLPLQAARGSAGAVYTIQAGLAFLDLNTAGLARWNSEEFFVPPGLWGAGIGGQFLGKLLEKLGALSSPVNRAEVTIGPQSSGTSPVLERTDVASRQQRNDLIAFYKRAGFQVEKDQLVWTRR